MKLIKYNQLILENDPTVIKGKWKINPQHEIRYKRDGKKEDLLINTAILSAEPNYLVISATARQSDQIIFTKILKLSGKWQADSKNRLQFYVKREKGKSDVLTFYGKWEIDKRNQIVYRFDKIRLKTKIKKEHKITFKGHWELSEKHRIEYVLEKAFPKKSSYFRFRGSFQTHSILAKKGEIRYQIGVEVRGKRKINTLVLFGKWKLSRDFALKFEVTYPKGKKHSLDFRIEFNPSTRSRISLELKTRKGKPYGVELILTRDFLKRKGSSFVRILKNQKELRTEAGLSFVW